MTLLFAYVKPILLCRGLKYNYVEVHFCLCIYNRQSRCLFPDKNCCSTEWTRHTLWSQPHNQKIKTEWTRHTQYCWTSKHIIACLRSLQLVYAFKTAVIHGHCDADFLPLGQLVIAPEVRFRPFCARRYPWHATGRRTAGLVSMNLRSRVAFTRT